MTKIDEKTKLVSDQLWKASHRESQFYPVDRYFLEKHLDQILSVEPVAFIQYNLEQFSDLYSTQLLVCLPELWEDLTVNDIVALLDSLTNILAIFGFILFTYKYLKIDIFSLITNASNLSADERNEIKAFLREQYPNLILQPDEWEDFKEMGVDMEPWVYVRQRLLIDERIIPAAQDVDSLKVRIETI